MNGCTYVCICIYATASSSPATLPCLLPCIHAYKYTLISYDVYMNVLMYICVNTYVYI